MFQKNPPQTNGRKSQKTSSGPCQGWAWRVFLNFEVWNDFFFSAPGVEMGHLNKAGKKNKWRSGYFCLEEKEEALNSKCQQFKELHWWLGAYMHTHTSICIHVAIQFKETGRLLDLHKAMFMVTVAASHTHI